VSVELAPFKSRTSKAAHLTRRSLGFLAKAAISVALLYFCLRAVDFDVLAQRLTRLDFRWVMFVFAALALQTVAATIRWQQIVLQLGAPLNFGRALYYMMVAAFFNQMLPSTVGGDAARVYLFARDSVNLRIASYSVLVDRGIGLFFLVILVAACLPWSLVLIKDQPGRIALLVIGIGGVAAGLGFATLAFVPKALAERWWVIRHVTGVAKASVRLWRPARTALTIGVLSIFIHLLTVMAAWGAAKSITAPLSFADALFLVPPVMLISIIPISIAGWGVREGVMVVAFGYAGLHQSDGLIVSLLIGLGMFILGVLGAIWWVFAGPRLSAFPENAAPA
jgi:uncharacterized membrane protein YbhN (UPF0104 family)